MVQGRVLVCFNHVSKISRDNEKIALQGLASALHEKKPRLRKQHKRMAAFFEGGTSAICFFLRAHSDYLMLEPLNRNQHSSPVPRERHHCGAIGLA